MNPVRRNQRIQHHRSKRFSSDELILTSTPTFVRLPTNPIVQWQVSPWAGWETKMITMANLDKFSHIGLLSGGTFFDGRCQQNTRFQRKGEAGFVSFGSREIDGTRPNFFGGDTRRRMPRH